MFTRLNLVLCVWSCLFLHFVNWAVASRENMAAISKYMGLSSVKCEILNSLQGYWNSWMIDIFLVGQECLSRSTCFSIIISLGANFAGWGNVHNSLWFAWLSIAVWIWDFEYFRFMWKFLEAGHSSIELKGLWYNLFHDFHFYSLLLNT